jgi:CRP/FNR family transcriptional regulator, cyclic AMP receptor protein
MSPSLDEELPLMRAIENLADVPLFTALKPAEREWIASHIHRRRFRADTTIIFRGAPGAALYILLSGRVKVQVDSLDGRDARIAVLGPGELFGELALLDGGECCADVSTLEPIEVVVMTRDDLMDCIREVPQVAMNLLAELAVRLRRTNKLILDLLLLDAQGRVARHLLELAQLHSVQSPAGVEIDLGVCQQDLASSTGVARETINRILGSFRRRGWITIDRQKRITLLRQDQLARRCGAHLDS